MPKTHFALGRQRFQYMALDAQIVQQELAAGHYQPNTAAVFAKFAAEVERLARQGDRHLSLVDSTPPAAPLRKAA